MKKPLSVFLITILVMSAAMPINISALALDDASMKKVQNEYFFDDFSKYNGSNITTNINETSIGYYGDDAYLEKYENEGDVGVAFTKYGSANTMNGPRGGNNVFIFNIDRHHFEDAGNTLVFNYDAYVPYSTDTKQALYSNIGYAKNGDMNYLMWMANGAKLYGSATAGAQYMLGYNAVATPTMTSTTLNTLYDSKSKMTLGLTEAEDGRWFNMKTVMKYDTASKSYISSNYVDGKPIISSETNEIAKLIYTPESDLLEAVQDRNSLAFSISARCGETGTAGKDIVIDNVAMYLCDTAVPEEGEVGGKTIVIPFHNGFNFTDTAAAPECVKEGHLNVDTAANATVRYTDGTEITDVMITAEENRIQIHLPASVGKGDKVQVDLTGVQDIAGNQVGLDQNEYTMRGEGEIENKSYFEDFSSIIDLSQAGYHPGNISSSDTNKTFVLGHTSDKGNGLQVNYSAASSSKAVVAPSVGEKGYRVSATTFETAGKEMEYGYDFYLPDGVYEGETLCGYLVLANSTGEVIQYCSELPALIKKGDSLKFKTTNGDSVYTDWKDGNGTFAANSKPGIDQVKESVYADQTPERGWVSIKARISYIKANDIGYYLTRYYINGNVVKAANGKPAIFTIQENIAPANSGREYVQFSIWGNNGENNPGKIIVDNIFADIVNADYENGLPNYDEDDPVQPTPEPPESGYMYEDFSEYNGSNITTTPGIGSALGYYGIAENFEKHQSGENTALKVIAPFSTNDSKKTTNLNGPRGGESNKFAFNISKSEFEDKGNKIVFSYDVMLNTNPDDKQQTLYANIGYGNDGVGNMSFKGWLASSAKFGGYGSADANRWMGYDNAYGRKDKTGGSENTYLSSAYDANTYLAGVKNGEWVKITTVLWYDQDNEGYFSSNYVDSKPITNKNGEIAVEKYYPTAEDLQAIQNRTSMCFMIQAGVGVEESSMNKSILIDNVCMRLYNGITVDEFQYVPSNDTMITASIYNGYRFSGNSIPNNVKMAAITNSELTSDNVVIEKFSKDDKLLFDGSVVENFRGKINQGVVTLSNVAARENGESLLLTFRNLKSVDGGGFVNSTMFLSDDPDFKGITKSSFFDLNGDELKIDSADNVSSNVNKIKLNLHGVTSAEITDGTITYSGANGVFDFSSIPLKTGTSYSIKLDGETYTTFTTTQGDGVFISDIKMEEDKAIAKYINTADTDKTVYFIGMLFDTNGNFIKASSEVKSLAKNSSNDIETDVITDDRASYYKAIVLENLKTVRPLTKMFEFPPQDLVSESSKSDHVFETTIFDNNGNATVKGNLGEDRNHRITSLVLDGNDNIVYANDLYAASDGTYAFVVNMSESVESGTYTLYISDDGKLISDGYELHYSKDSSKALELINGASSASLLAQVIKNNQTELAFYYHEFEKQFTDADKSAVSEILFAEKEHLKAVNGIGFSINDQAASVIAYRKAVLMQAVHLGIARDYTDLSTYFSELASGTVYEWLDYNGSRDITAALRSIWQAEVFRRLKGAKFTSYEDFLTKFRPSLLFACIKNADGYGNIQRMLTDYINNSYITELRADHVTGAVCSKLVNKNYAGFTYTQLIDDINSYYIDAAYNNNSGGNGNGGGTGAVISGGLKPSVPVESETTTTEKSEIFQDIHDCWAKEIIIELAEKGIVSGIGDGKFAPEENITREEFVAIVIRVLHLSESFDSTLPFEDVRMGVWYYDAVKIAYQQGIINGISDIQFGSGENISRQDMTVILKNALDLNGISMNSVKNNFIDADLIADYAIESVNSLVGMNIINGYNDDTFRPEGLATRAEAAKLIYEVLPILNK